MTKKTCRLCKQLKLLTEFSKAAGNKDGYNNTCKQCVVVRNRDYWRTPYGRISYIRNQQKTSSVARGHAPPSYTQNQLYDWAVGQGLFNLVATWENSGWLQELAPSIDRLDVTKGYSFDNIRLVTWKDNNDAQYMDRKTCKVVTKQNRKVVQKALDGTFIAEHLSIAAAARATGAIRTNINAMCKGTNPNIKSVGGFLWEYA